MQQTELALDTPSLDAALVAGLRRHGWRLVRSAMVDQEARYWFSGKEQTPQRDATGASRPLPPLCKTATGAAAMLKDLEATKR